MTVKEHYDKHLGDFYAWMIGDFAQKQHEQMEILKSLSISEDIDKTAIDLGCGHGIQTIALAKMGYHVVAVDFNNQLLQELESHCENLPVKIIETDILSFLKTPGLADLITCMGDTLTHFENIHVVKDLIKLISHRLTRSGKLVLSFRDLSNEFTNEARFIPVKSDDQKILTCFLEYFPEYVMVHDILWEKREGKWIQKISSYPKLKLSVKVIVEILAKNNLIVSHTKIINNMNYIVAEKTIDQPI